MRACLSILGAALTAASIAAAAPVPAGLWEFHDPENPLAATVGADLVIEGEHALIPGPGGEQAARIGPGSHYRAAHGIAPNGGGEKVNQYSVLMDLRTTLEHRFYALLQTDPANARDNICEIMNRERNVGIGATGYSRVRVIAPHTWFRLVIVVDNAAGRFDIYRDGERVLQGVGQPLDGDFALAEEVIFLGDDDGDDNTIDAARIAIFAEALDTAAVEALEGAYPRCPGLAPPEPALARAAKTEAAVGERLRIGVRADPLRPVRFQVDWGDGVITDWSAQITPGAAVNVPHAYAVPGEREIKVRLMDECGQRSPWTPLHSVKVTGQPEYDVLTPPYLQNVRPDGLAIMWEANAKAPAKAAVKAKPNGEARVFPATLRYSGHGSFIYTAEVSGLAPDAAYGFRAVMDDDFEAGAGAFRTAPSGFRPFSFGVWADSQGENRGAYAADPLEPTRAMMAHMAASGVDIAIGAGDHAENGDAYIPDTRNFFLDRVARHLGSKVPYFIAWGNHDSYQDAVIRRFADMPSKERPGFDAGYGSFAFTYADCRFICIDYASMRTDVLNWLPRELASAPSRDARHRFLFVHVPPYCELWIDGDAFLRAHLVPLMEAHGVEMCFSGHTHNYERGYKNGVHYVITGGGSWLDFGEEVVHEWEHMFIGGKEPAGPFEHGLVNQYMRISVDEAGWRAECVAFAPDGTEIGVIDRFTSRDTGPPSAE